MQLIADSVAEPFLVSAFGTRRHYPLSSVGTAVEQQLLGDHDAQIIAVFERSFYLKTAAGLICVGLAEIGRGPLNALLTSQQKCLPFSVDVGQRVRVSDGVIMLNDHCIVDAAQASFYRCDTRYGVPKPQTFLRNRQVLRSLQGTPQQGFFWLLGNQIPLEHESALQLALRQTTASSVDALSEGLLMGFNDSNINRYHTDACNHAFPSAVGLLGAGPGLTPAGDDVISGVLLALYRLQRPDIGRSLWHSIEPLLSGLTNPISAAHLQQAAQGYCGEPMDAVLNYIFQAEKVEATTLVAALNRMGCTSGWDTLGGAVLAIDAWQNSLHTTHRTVTTC